MEFEAYLKSQSQHEGTDPEGRFIKNAFCIEERVVLPASYWRYFDWLLDRYVIDVDRYWADCDKDRGDMTFSENAMRWVYQDMLDRKEAGDPLPDFLGRL
ncbi:MAG: hypothetical protein JJ891_16105 [Rhizobiaceae bacterium]|nr:hypothetical protein [Rhizobiaceae bacterium]